MSLLEVKDLNVTFQTNDERICAVNTISFNLDKGRTLGVVGESGSGKSQTVLALMGLSDANALVSGSVKLDGQELINLPVKALNRVRGNEMAMIFQDPMASLNPYLSIETQLCETMIIHQKCSKSDARKQALAMLDAVHIPDATNRIKLYPHEFSGGMRQRVMIAMALMCQPKLLIADEPTTALDVTVQAQLLKLLRELQQDFKMATILITHDMGVVASNCDEVMVMYAGSPVELADVQSLFAYPSHPYTSGLMAATPRIDLPQETYQVIPGEPPDLSHVPIGCPFVPRCQRSTDICHQKKPFLEALDNQNTHYASCFHANSDIRTST